MNARFGSNSPWRNPTPGVIATSSIDASAVCSVVVTPSATTTSIPSTRVSSSRSESAIRSMMFAIEGLLRRDALRLRHERLCELRVASSLLGELPHRRRGVLLDLPRERHAADPDGRGSADVGRRRHGGDVAGHQDEGARRGGPRAFRRHVADHRGRRRLDRLDDLLHRGAETPRCIDREEHGGGSLGILDAVPEVVGDEGVDHAFEREADHGVRGRLGGRARGEAWRGRPRRGARRRPAFGRSSTSRSPSALLRGCLSCDAPAYSSRFSARFFGRSSGRFSGRFPPGATVGISGGKSAKAPAADDSVYREEPEWTLGTKARSSPGRSSN